MKRKELAGISGITSRNIRFYQTAGLLLKKAGKDRRRQFSNEDTQALKEIRVLRSLGVSLPLVQSVRYGTLSLRDCMDLRIREIDMDGRDDLLPMKAVCRMLRDASGAPDFDRWLVEINRCKSRGEPLIDITCDCDTYARNIVPKAAFWFEPEEPVLTAQDFTREIENFCSKERRTLQMLHTGMEPVARIDGTPYLFMLEQPRILNFRFSPFFFLQSFGFKFAYAYAYQPVRGGKKA